ncbi:MAG: AAA family ATPase [Bacteroidia bacterium]|nr:AAA family ATPase [Bacteroidia bacterium]
MKTYKEFQESVYNWFMDKNKADPSFTFSLRQKANKGSELNYFIGTERSKYFGTTLWTIPVGFPGSSQDLTDIFFGFDDDKLKYYIEFTQTKNPDSKQNTSALNLIQNIKEEIRSSVALAVESRITSKMESYKTKSPEKAYTTIEDLLSDLEKQLDIIIPIVEKGITNEQKKNSSFIAHRITEEEFENMQLKLKERQKKYAKNPETDDDLNAAPENIQKDLENHADILPLNQILFGPPGTGKTYNTINKALKIVARDFYLKNEKNRKALTQKFKELSYDPKTEKGQVAFVTFHQSMSYEDFIEGIKPLDPEENDGQIVYDVMPGIFKKIVKSASTTGSNFQEKIEWLKKKCAEAESEKPLLIKTKGSEFSISFRGGRTFKIKPSQSLNPQAEYTASIENIRRVYEGASRKDVYNPTYVVGILDYLYTNGLNRGKSINASNETPYVLIIDEINRGNVSQIFGELITLIEEDKRLGKDEALEVILPYSKEKFGVPPNLYIIGTMNTADRSIEALDTALRRRFSFETILPDSGLIEDKGNLKKEQGIDLALIMDTINKRIEKLLDRDHQIGHSYFMSVKTIENLKEIFRHNIIPLLQEYFFGDYGKIGLVLGSKFFEDDGKQDQNTEKIFADFNDYDIDELEKRPVYKLVDPKKLTDDEFKAAIKELLL